jgi:fructose-bisphosphate aldolase class 1
MAIVDLESTVKALVADGKGILAADDSKSTPYGYNACKIST